MDRNLIVLDQKDINLMLAASPRVDIDPVFVTFKTLGFKKR